MIEIITYKDKEHKVSNGTYYHIKTSDQVINALESARINNIRIRLFYGDVETGRSWLDEYDMVGNIGRSMGSVKIPLLIANTRSMGGGSILDDCIIAIYSTSGALYYKHPLFHTGEMVVVPSDLPEYESMVTVNGEIHARFKTYKQAQNWIDFMQGRRFRAW